MWLPVAGLAFFGAGFGPTNSRKKNLLGFLLLYLVLSGVIFSIACGGGSSQSSGGGGGTPAGLYTVTVTGTAGSLKVNAAGLRSPCSNYVFEAPNEVGEPTTPRDTYSEGGRGSRNRKPQILNRRATRARDSIYARVESTHPFQLAPATRCPFTTGLQLGDSPLPLHPCQSSSGSVGGRVSCKKCFASMGAAMV
jgi:hypothetical protein